MEITERRQKEINMIGVGRMGMDTSTTITVLPEKATAFWVEQRVNIPAKIDQGLPYVQVFSIDEVVSKVLEDITLNAADDPINMDIVLFYPDGTMGYVMARFFNQGYCEDISLTPDMTGDVDTDPDPEDRQDFFVYEWTRTQRPDQMDIKANIYPDLTHLPEPDLIVRGNLAYKVYDDTGNEIPWTPTDMLNDMVQEAKIAQDCVLIIAIREP